ncbi:MAG: hypothetical protein IJ400_06760 [Clostridia bacterium]|nr:hypothetical protein [Clostridia bacterium]
MNKQANKYLISTLKLLSIFIILGCLILIELLVCDNSLYEKLYILPRADKYLSDLIASYALYVGTIILWFRG